MLSYICATQWCELRHRCLRCVARCCVTCVVTRHVGAGPLAGVVSWQTCCERIQGCQLPLDGVQTACRGSSAATQLDAAPQRYSSRQCSGKGPTSSAWPCQWWQPSQQLGQQTSRHLPPTIMDIKKQRQADTQRTDRMDPCVAYVTAAAAVAGAGVEQGGRLHVPPWRRGPSLSHGRSPAGAPRHAP